MIRCWMTRWMDGEMVRWIDGGFLERMLTKQNSLSISSVSGWYLSVPKTLTARHFTTANSSIAKPGKELTESFMAWQVISSVLSASSWNNHDGQLKASCTLKDLKLDHMGLSVHHTGFHLQDCSTHPADCSLARNQLGRVINRREANLLPLTCIRTGKVWKIYTEV